MTTSDRLVVLGMDGRVLAVEDDALSSWIGRRLDQCEGVSPMLRRQGDRLLGALEHAPGGAARCIVLEIEDGPTYCLVAVAATSV